jgi:hypothetical protein
MGLNERIQNKRLFMKLRATRMKDAFKLTREIIERAAHRLESERFGTVCADLGVTNITLRSALKREGLYVYRGNPLTTPEPAPVTIPVVHGWDSDFASQFISRPMSALA